MSPKQKNKEAQKLLCLSFLILENLDNLKVTEPKMVKYRDDLIGFIEEMSNSVSDTQAMRQSTYFWDISKQIDTVIRKNFENI